MPYADLGSHQLYYEVSGPDDGEPLVLIHGLGAHMIAWYPGFCQALQDVGFRLIRFDNRDTGLSSKFDHAPDYTFEDMAADVVGLIDHLGLHAAHVVGQSMGGMIGQQLAISYPHRVRSLCSIYSAPSMGFLTDDEEAWAIRDRPWARDREEAIQQYIERERLSGLDGFDDEWITTFAAEVYDRNYCPEGEERQKAASEAALDRRPGLARLTMPTAVLHGLDDRLISYTGGIATAVAVPNAELHLYAGMSHQIPPSLWSDFVRVISRTAGRASADAAAAGVDAHVGRE